MSTTARIPSPAKINLHLEIGPRIPGGYHQLRSVFQMIDLQDELTISLEPPGSGFSLLCSEYELPESNTLKTAWNLFNRAAGTQSGCSVQLTKRIPPEAGLGGGSSNAAAMLFGLNLLNGFPLVNTELSMLGGRIGSDVPFFFGSPAAFAEGTGDMLTPLDPVERLQGIAVKPVFGISTAWAYRSLDSRRENPDSYDWLLSRDDCMTGCSPEKIGNWKFFNSFEPMIAEQYPQYAEIRGILESHGAYFSILSGSGSAMIGLFRDSLSIKRCLSAMHARFYWAQWVKILANSPFAVYNKY